MSPKLKKIVAYLKKNRLFENFYRSSYNKLVRPAFNVTESLVVRLNLRLSQLIDVVIKFFIYWHKFHKRKKMKIFKHEKEQIVTTNVWLHQEWSDSKLMWDPEQYEGIQSFYVPAEMIWLPDLVLYNKYVTKMGDPQSLKLSRIK